MDKQVSSTEHVQFDLGILNIDTEDPSCRMVDKLLQGLCSKNLKEINQMDYNYTIQIKIKRKKIGESEYPYMTAQITATKLYIQKPEQLDIFNDNGDMEMVLEPGKKQKQK